MASTSPYQNNDLQAASTFRPYKLPINDIFKASSAINAYWDEGARRVKNAYDGILNLNLRTTDNRQIRDQFIKDAEQQITKISSMNLADPSVQRQGIGIFQPLLKDQDIVGEDYVVKNADRELATGEGFRTKDGGKNYNPLSIENIQFEQNLLSVDPSKGGLNKRDGWRALYNNQSKYTPYTDITKEYKDIQDSVKASETKNAQLSGDQWYIEELDKKGVSKERMQAAIQEMGSPQLKEQMRVEGRNIYYKKLAGDPTQVDGYFQQLAGSYYDTKINELGSKKAELEYQNAMTPDKPEYSSKKDAYKRAAEQLDKVIVDLATVQKPKFMADFVGLSNTSNLSSNLSKIEQLWQQSSIDNLAGKLSWETSSHEIKANPAKIAQENLALGYKRVEQDYAQLSETKRHNMADEQINMIKALKEGKGKGSGDGSSGNDLLPGADGNNVPVNYNTTSQENLKTEATNAEAVRKDLEDKDAPLQEAMVKNIIGEQALVGIQQANNTAKTVGDVLVPSELERAATFFKAFSDKNSSDLPAAMRGSSARGVEIPATIDDVKNTISKMNVRDFKNLMSSVAKGDTDFTSDLINKMAVENGVDKAADFRATYNNILKNQINLSQNINNKVAERLGDYGKLFTNGGKVNLTNEEIASAYNKGLQNHNVVAYYKEVKQGGLRSDIERPSQFVPVTKEEYDKLPEYNRYQKVPSLDEFTSIIRKRTDPVYSSLKTENNQAGTQYTYDDKNHEEKVATLNRFATISPDLVGTDANPDNAKIFEFLKSHPKNLVAHEIKTPNPGETLPSVKFTMEKFGSGSDKEQEDAMVDKVNSTWFRTTDVPGKYFEKGNSTGNVRYTGAYLAYAPAKMPNGQQSSVEITNIGRSAATVVPDIKVNNLYTFTNDGSKRFITAEDIKKQFEYVYKVPMDIYAQNNVDEINKFIASFVTNIEKKNKEIEEKNKK